MQRASAIRGPASMSWRVVRFVSRWSRNHPSWPDRCLSRESRSSAGWISAGVAEAGRFTLLLPARKYRLGLSSPVYQVLTSEVTATGQVVLMATVRPLEVDPAQLLAKTAAVEVKIDAPAAAEPSPDGPEVAASAESDPPSTLVSVGRIGGRIVDETGHPLPGVRVIAVDPRSRSIVGVATAEEDGRYSLALRPGAARLHPVSSGLALPGPIARDPSISIS